MIHVLVSFDANYMQHTQVMLYSLCKHTKESVEVWLLNLKLTDEQCAACKRFIERKCGAELKIIDMDPSMFRGMPTCGFSIECYSRIMALNVLPKELSRVLWLDGDIIVNNDVAPFYHQELGDKYCVACKDNWADTEHIKTHQVALGIPNTHEYFNSGVLLLNLEILRRNITLDDIQSAFVKLKDAIHFPDQDILNYLYTYRTCKIRGQSPL